jgi:hypothetical protein
MATVFIIISSILTLAAVIPYIRDILKKKTKPRVVSWFTWSLLAGISAAASFSAHQYPAAILSISSCIECLAIVILGFKNGDKHFEFFDVACQIGAFTGLILWWIYNSPAIAIVAAILIDFIAGLPTLRHAWRRPNEETWATYALSGLGAAFTLAAVNNYMITSAANPIYLVLMNAAFTVVILTRRNKSGDT